ncbi:hypothetical protein SDC9_104672 [bioreactor metagenome]|uniref:Uncharacterized protein n=1 Tax=bioreactor metagenome TaxID=1076179 RepID=A0A645AYK2_9ZZZZ
MIVINKKKEINESYKRVGKSAEDYAIQMGDFLASHITGYSVLQFDLNDDLYDVKSIASKHKRGDIKLTTRLFIDGKQVEETYIIEVKKNATCFNNRLVLEHHLYSYIDETTGRVVPERKGWFDKRGVDYYLFIYNDNNSNEEQMIFVKESELWDCYQNNIESIKSSTIQNGWCSLIPCSMIIENCPSTLVRTVYEEE